MAKATAGSGEGRPRVTSKDRKSNLDSSRVCTTAKAEDFEMEAKSRGDDTADASSLTVLVQDSQRTDYS